MFAHTNTHSHSLNLAEEDFVLVQSASFRHNQRQSVLHPSITYAHGMHAQTGTSSSMVSHMTVTWHTGSHMMCRKSITSLTHRHQMTYRKLHGDLLQEVNCLLCVWIPFMQLMRRPVPGVRRMAPHPNLTYCKNCSLLTYRQNSCLSLPTLLSF